jgi:hypothetical protein
LDQYGYGAFGLTVIPYAVMSIVNLIGNAACPEYPKLYMIQSQVMNEAERRGGRFSGTVGVQVVTESDDTNAFPPMDTEDSVTFQVDEDENTLGNTTFGFKDEDTPRYTNDTPTTIIFSSSGKLMSCRRTKLDEVFT